MTSSSSTAGYTTLPPIFAAAARASPMSVSHTARSRAAAAASTSGGSQTARGSTDRRGVKPALPEFRHKKDLTHRRNGGGSGGGSDVASNVARHTAGATLIASNRKVAAGGSDAKRLGRTGGGSGPGVGNGMHHHLVGVSANSGGRSSSDEATIGADGTVTFGPNLSLLMSSLAVRFDDGHGNGSNGGGGRRLGDDTDPLPVGVGSLSFLSSRSRAEAKKREWTTMNALYAKAMEDKTTTKEQTQWFLARFNYNAHPIMHTPAPNTGAGILPPPGMRQAVQQQHQQQQQQQSGGLLTSPSASHLAPAPEHAHLLHSSASASFLSPKSQQQATATDQMNNHAAAISVEEEPEEYQDEL